MKAVIGALALVFLVSAANPPDVARVVLEDGYFIEQGADATDAAVGAAVFDARASGGLLSVVVLADEPAAGATTYADAVANFAPQGTILVVAPQTVGWSTDGVDWTADELNHALDRSLDGSSSDEVVTIFVAELVHPSSSSGGGGGAGFLVVIGLIVLAGIAFFVWRSAKSNTARVGRITGDLRNKARVQVEDVANDILDLEDEVRQAGGAEVTARYQKASQIYSEATDALDRANTPQEIVAASAKLDDAIWNLDAVEALLDGKPVPPKPEPPKAAPPSPISPAPPANAPSSPTPLQPYTRRETRRSSFGAGDILAAVLASRALRNAGRSGPTGGFGGGIGGFGRSSSRSTGGGMRGGGGRMRGGGRRRG